MRRINFFGLALTLVLGGWVGNVSAAPLEAQSALLVPYYKAGDNLATLIGVQHVGDQPAGVSSIAVFVHDGENGKIVEKDNICLGKNEFGFVGLVDKTTTNDTRRGIFFSVEDDSIPTEGFVTLAYEGSKNDCDSGVGTSAPTGKDVMVAWAVLQDIGSGFFATEIPVTEAQWGDKVGGVTAKPARDAQDEPYCYENTDSNRAAVPDQLNDAKNGCDSPYTHTFVRRGTKLPAITAIAAAPGVDFKCDSKAECPGLGVNSQAEIGARFDVVSFNRSVSNIYLWLSTAPPDGRDVEVTVACEDGTLDGTLESGTIEADDYVNVINPANLPRDLRICKGRGTLSLTLSGRGKKDDFCHARNDKKKEVVDAALDDKNNKCNRFIRKRNDDQADNTHKDAYFCYDTTKKKSSEATIADRVPGAEIRNSKSSTPNRVTSCHSFTYVPDVPEDNPNGFIFSHISQMDAHYRMNFNGYSVAASSTQAR